MYLQRIESALRIVGGLSYEEMSHEEKAAFGCAIERQRRSLVRNSTIRVPVSQPDGPVTPE